MKPSPCMPRAAVIAAAVVMCLPGPSKASDYWVDGTAGVGIDAAGRGSESNPFASIQGAIQYASLQADDVVHVRPKTAILDSKQYLDAYTGTNNVIAPTADGTSGHPITFKADAPRRVILDGGGSLDTAVNLAGRSYIRVEGFEIRGYKGDVIDLSPSGGSGGVGHQIAKNYIHHCNTGTWDITTGIKAGRTRNVLIEDNEIAWCGGAGIDAAAVDNTTDHLIIRGNNIHHVGADGIDVAGSNILIERNRLWDSCWGWGHQDAISVLGCQTVVIRYNMVGDFTQLVYGGLDKYSDPSTPFHDLYIYGNVFYNSAYKTLYDGGCPGVKLGFSDEGQRNVTEIQIHSNTFLYLDAKPVEVYGSSSFTLNGLRVYNNVFYACRGDLAGGPMYDWGGFADPAHPEVKPMKNVRSDDNGFYRCGYGDALHWPIEGQPNAHTSWAGPYGYDDNGDVAECDHGSWLSGDEDPDPLVESYAQASDLFNVRLLPAHWGEDDNPLRKALPGSIKLPPHQDANSNPIFPGDDAPFQDMDRHLRDPSKDPLVGAYTGEKRVDVYDQNGEYVTYRTDISAGVGVASSGYTLVVRPATYTEAVDLGIKNLTLKSSNPRDPAVVAATVIKGTGTGPTLKLSTTTGSVLEGLTIRGGSQTTHGVLVQGAKTTIANCVIAHNPGAGIVEDSGVASAPENALNIYDCVIADNTGGGVSIVGEGRFLRHCTITGNGGSAAVSIASGGTATVANCIVWGNTGTPISGTATVHGTDTDTDPKFGTVPGVGGEPGVYPGNDYPLALGSPCIDTGADASGDMAADILDLDNDTDFDEPVPLDVAGSSRIRGTALDMGAYEVPHGRWIWTTTGGGNWDAAGSWRKEAVPDASLHSYPDLGMSSAYIDTYATVSIAPTDPPAQAAALHLGSRPEAGGYVEVQSGGALSLYHLEIGQAEESFGGFTVTDGALTAGTLRVAAGPSSFGTLNLNGTASATAHPVRIGCADAADGTITMAGATLNAQSVRLRADLNAANGTLIGYGKVEAFDNDPEFVNNGWVEAKGYGDDHTLALSGFEVTCDLYEPPAVPCGWYATDHGRLELPEVYISSSGDYVWGSDEWNSWEPYVNLVNSMLIHPTADLPSSPPPLIIALLDWHRTTEAAIPMLAGSPETPTGYVPLAIWELASPASEPEADPNPVPFTAANVTLQYDRTNDAAFYPCYSSVGESGLVLAEAVLSGSTWSWHVLSWSTAGIDPDLHTLTFEDVPFQSDREAYLTVVQGYVATDTPTCDINLDGATDTIDVLIFGPAFGTEDGDPGYDAGCDFNSDDSVDVLDTLALIGRFGLTLADDCNSQRSAVFGSGQGALLSDESRDTLYDALQQAGLLDIYLDYIAEHPEAAR